MSHESFWDFSLRLYRLPQVSDTCLTLQNVHGFDVNLLLFACWYGRAHGAISPALLSEVLQFSTHWSTEVVRPLRHARTWMKGELAQPLSHVAELSGVAELREKIKAVELRSEQLQQQALERLAQECLRTQLSIRDQSPAPGAAAIDHNLLQLCEASAVPLTPALADLLQILQEKALSR
jgi:uncharacterized protein (TIGR02444 family)